MNRSRNKNALKALVCTHPFPKLVGRGSHWYTQKATQIDSVCHSCEVLLQEKLPCFYPDCNTIATKIADEWAMCYRCWIRPGRVRGFSQ